MLVLITSVGKQTLLLNEYCVYTICWYLLECLLYCTEHIISIVASLVKNCEGIQRQRLINKFTENDHEKIDRLMEMHFKYLDRVNKADDKIEHKKRVSFCS